MCSAQKGLLKDRMRVLSKLWSGGIKAEMFYKKNPKMLSQFQYCEREAIPFSVVLGEEELKHQSVKIRDTFSKEEVRLM